MSGQPNFPISVLLPVRNGAETIEAALRSVLNDLADDDNVIVVDDHSSDGSGDVVRAIRDARVTLHLNPGNGIVDALNHGLELASGKFIARCDADDEWLPGHASVLRELLLQAPDAVAAFGSARIIDSSGHDDGLSVPPDEEDLGASLLRSNPLVHGTVLIDRHTLIKTGGYRARAGAEDYDLWLRLSAGGRIRTTSVPVYVYRLSEKSSHARKRRVQARSSVRILISHALRTGRVSIPALARNTASALWIGPRYWYRG